MYDQSKGGVTERKSKESTEETDRGFPTVSGLEPVISRGERCPGKIPVIR